MSIFLFSKDWVRLKPLQVDEGGRVSISTDNLEVILNLSKYGIRDDDIIFHVIMQPSHGVVHLSEWERHDVKRFSLSDINNDEVLSLLEYMLTKSYYFLTFIFSSL